ncbi:MAG: BACON domain-containing protein, partial [Phycisphaerae bacterium]|nr:BACON domain-containing protein [Phycisphaerae bacterium]
RDPEYLDVVKTHAELIFPHRGDRIGMLDEPRDRMMPAWIATPRHELGYHAWVVHQGMITFPLARWIYLVNRDPSLRAEHGADADAWLADIIEMTAAFEEEVHDGPNRGEQYYDFRYMREDPDDPMPFNQQNALGRTFVMLWLITGDEQYRARAEGLARFFKRRLTLIDDRYTWLYSVFSTWHEDVGHAGINVDFAFQCYRAGIVFDAVDMQRFANTVRYLSLGADGFLGTVNGIPASGPEDIPGILRWIHLGFVDPGLRPIFDEYVQANWTTGSMFWLGSAYLAETSHPDRFEYPLTTGSATPILLSEPSLTAAGSVSEGVAERSFTVTTGGMTRLDYEITTSENWLTVTPAAGSVTCGADSITVQFGAAAPLPSQCGPHTAVISVSAPGTAIEPQTIDVTLTILPSTPDFDRDDDVDLTDFGTFQACFNGPNRPPFYPSCGATDLDCDGDVDLADFGIFAACFNGPNRQMACQ